MATAPPRERPNKTIFLRSMSLLECSQSSPACASTYSPGGEGRGGEGRGGDLTLRVGNAGLLKSMVKGEIV